MLPENFREQLIRVFLKKTDEDSIKKANILFDRWCREKNMRPSKVCIYMWNLEQLEQSGYNTPKRFHLNARGTASTPRNECGDGHTA